MTSFPEVGICSGNGALCTCVIVLLLTGNGRLYQPVDGKCLMSVLWSSTIHSIRRSRIFNIQTLKSPEVIRKEMCSGSVKLCVKYLGIYLTSSRVLIVLLTKQSVLCKSIFTKIQRL